MVSWFLFFSIGIPISFISFADEEETSSRTKRSREEGPEEESSSPPQRRARTTENASSSGPGPESPGSSSSDGVFYEQDTPLVPLKSESDSDSSPRQEPIGSPEKETIRSVVFDRLMTILRDQNAESATSLDAIDDVLKGFSKPQLIEIQKDLEAKGKNSIYLDQVKRRQTVLDTIEDNDSSSTSQ